MNPGYISLWIVMILFILMATGWSEWVGAASFNKRILAIIAAGCIILQPLQHTTAIGNVSVVWHASAILLMLAALSAVHGQSLAESKWYLLLCALLTGVIWGCLQKMYLADPVFYWLDPRWDAPLLGGLLAAAFSSKAKHQFAVLVFSAVFAEINFAVLSGGRYIGGVGELAWWDGLWIAFGAARVLSLSFGILRSVMENLAVFFMKNKRSSPE
ncbi:hypothetical protein [Paenibacillus sp. NPDC058174]|uniref:YphA family membrane protein n=1 Tax=Paenibacillus sp. NPDC058174 TaxID=3346366 RepID=UPI0036DDB3DB